MYILMIDAALDEAGKVVKKQKLCNSKCNDYLDKLISIAQECRASAQSGGIQQLSSKAEALHKELNSSTRELHSSISKFSKVVEKLCDSQDVCRALEDVKFDQQLLNKVIAEHLYREGRLALADQFVAEAALPDAAQLASAYVALHNIRQQILARNLAPALAWAQQHRSQLSQAGGPSSFEFQLHGLNFLAQLTSQGQAAALAYAKQHFAAFKEHHMRDIQRLMGCLLFADRPPAETPYADLLLPPAWESVAAEFSRQACGVMGQACDSPLATALAAGSVALPALLKLAGVMERGGQGRLSACQQLPIELPLGREFVYHSIFACPVSRDQASDDNPPKLLPCNHVLCEQSILRIARSRSRVFKCPYCPMEARADNTRQLIFPDVD